jgi:hypothetical protein
MGITSPPVSKILRDATPAFDLSHWYRMIRNRIRPVIANPRHAISLPWSNLHRPMSVNPARMPELSCEFRNSARAEVTEFGFIITPPGIAHRHCPRTLGADGKSRPADSLAAGRGASPQPGGRQPPIVDTAHRPWPKLAAQAAPRRALSTVGQRVARSLPERLACRSRLRGKA